MDVLNDAKRAVYILDYDFDNANKVKSSLRRGYFTTNENLFYLTKFAIKDRDILSICGSGDHPFMYLIHGAKKVDTFDNNPLQYYIMDLKRAAMIGLEKVDFLNYFPIFGGAIKEMYNPKYYEFFSKYLHKDAKQFWDYVYDNSDNKLYLLQLFSYPVTSESDYTLEYDYLKKRLKEDSITFRLCDVYHISKHVNKNTYYIADLSNVYDHIYKNKEYNEKEYLDLIRKEFLPLLTDDGTCIFHHQLSSIQIKSFKDYPSIQSKGDTIKILTK